MPLRRRRHDVVDRLAARSRARISDDEIARGPSRTRRCDLPRRVAPARRRPSSRETARTHRHRESNELEDALGAISSSRRRARPPRGRRTRLVVAGLSSESTVRRADRARRSPRGTSSNASRASSSRVSAGVVVTCGRGRRRRGRAARRARARRWPLARGRRGRRAEDRRRPEDAYCHSSSSSPTSTCVPGLDPETAKCLLELVGRRRRADHAIAAIGPQDPKARPRAGAGRVLEELRNRLVRHGLHGRDRAQLEERTLQLVDPAAGRARRRDDALDAGIRHGRSPDLLERSTLFSTTS